MNIQNIEKKEKNMATFEVKVPADVFDNAVNEAYKKNKNHLYVAGFRKGKAPRAVIEGMYGKEVFYPDAIEALAEGIERRKALKLGYWAFTLVFAVSVRCSPLTVVALPDFLIDHFPLKSTAEFVRLDGLTCDRRDLSQLQAVTEWLSVHLGDGETAYMITDDMLYNPGHLRNCLLPEQPLDGKLPDSFSVPGTHNFPMSFFEAKYVVTVDPYPLSYASDTELGHKLNAKFAELRDGTHTLAATFDMGNGYTFTIWERVAAPTRAEVESYLHVFDAENAQYPEMFSQVAESWLAAHGL